jgi:crotonobetainyl-CoA:carnitine CoA-transferase CaiB-like acyl-CoA transferase
MTDPLAGIVVIAWEQAVAAPLATRHLADLGASVVKIERPGDGDQARHYDGAVEGMSAHFVWLNRGKRSVALDLKDARGRAVLEALLARADVFVRNQGPGAASRLSLDFEQLSPRHPSLVQCAISGYGPAGPYRDRKAYDLLVQGEAGVMALTGSDAHPVKAGIPVADIAAGMYAFSSILAALYARQRDGVGATIEITMLESLTEWVTAAAAVSMYAGREPARMEARHSFIVPYGPYRVADGFVNLAVQNESQWRRLCTDVLASPDLVDDPRFRTNELRLTNRDALESLIEASWRDVPKASLEALLEAADVPFGDLRTLDEVIRHPQLAARDRWAETDSPVGTLRTLLHPMNIAGLSRPRTRIPTLGEDMEEVLREFGLAGATDEAEAERSRPTGRAVP